MRSIAASDLEQIKIPTGKENMKFVKYEEKKQTGVISDLVDAITRPFKSYYHAKTSYGANSHDSNSYGIDMNPCDDGYNGFVQESNINDYDYVLK